MLLSRRHTHPNPAMEHGSRRLHTDRSRSEDRSVSSMMGRCETSINGLFTSPQYLIAFATRALVHHKAHTSPSFVLDSAHIAGRSICPLHPAPSAGPHAARACFRCGLSGGMPTASRQSPPRQARPAVIAASRACAQLQGLRCPELPAQHSGLSL